MFDNLGVIISEHAQQGDRWVDRPGENYLIKHNPKKLANVPSL
jgi:hypothetical protein